MEAKAIALNLFKHLLYPPIVQVEASSTLVVVVPMNHTTSHHE